MATYKFYAIKKGFKTGLFFGLWNEIEPYVKGYTGAIYKSFNDKNLANTWLGSTIESNKKIKNETMTITKNINEDECPFIADIIYKNEDEYPFQFINNVIYVNENECPFVADKTYKNQEELLKSNKAFLKKLKKDKKNKKKDKENQLKELEKKGIYVYDIYICGHYNYEKKICNYSFLIIRNNKIYKEFFNSVKDRSFDICNDVLGEMYALEDLFRYIIDDDFNINEINVFYRSENIMKWYNHQFLSKTISTKNFVKNCEEFYHSERKIIFKKDNNSIFSKKVEQICMNNY